MTRDGTCGVFIPEMVVAGPIGRGSDRTGRVDAQQVMEGGGGINTPHVSSSVILHPPALEDGTDRGFRNVGF